MFRGSHGKSASEDAANVLYCVLACSGIRSRILIVGISCTLLILVFPQVLLALQEFVVSEIELRDILDSPSGS